MARYLKLLALLLLATSVAHGQQLYNRFGPVTGVLKGNVNSPQTSAAMGSDIGLLLFPTTAAEISCGATIINQGYPAGNINRYGTNTTPGTTDMSVALQTAVNCNNAAYIPAGTYLVGGITVPHTAGLVIRGDGNSSILKQKGGGVSIFSWNTSAMDFSVQVIRDLQLNGTNGSAHTMNTTGEGALNLINLYFNQTPTGFDSLFINGAASAKTHDVRVENVQFYTNLVGNAAVELGALASDVWMSDLTINGNFDLPYGVYFDSGAGAVRIENSNMYNTTNNVVHGAGTNNFLIFTHDEIAFSSGADVVSLTNSSDIIFSSVYIDDVQAGFNGVTLNNTNGVSFINGMWLGVTGAGYTVNETGTSNFNYANGGNVTTNSVWTSGIFHLIGAASKVCSVAGATDSAACSTVAGLANPTGTIGLTAVNGSATTAPRSDSAPALSQSIVPTWTGIHTFSATPVFSAGINVGGASFTGLANPSGTVGLTAVNGTATTAPRSDSSPALSQAISPTWTGNHTFTPTSGVPLTVNANGANAVSFNGSNGSIQVDSSGDQLVFTRNAFNFITATGASATLQIQASGSGGSLVFGTNGGARETIASDGGLTIGSPTGGDKGAGTINAGGLFVNGVSVAGGGSGTVTSLTGGTGVTATPSTITTTGSFAVDQTFSPTWTGDHNFTATSGVPVTITPASSTNGLNLVMGTSSTGRAINITNSSASAGSSSVIYLGNAGSNVLQFGLSASNNTTAFFTNGPTSEQIFWGSNGSVPISIGTNASERIRVTGTGNVSINTPASGTALTVNGVANGSSLNALQIGAPNTTGQSNGLGINAGTNSSDQALLINNAANSSTLLKVSGNGAILVPGIPSSSSAATGTVCWTSPGTLSVDTTVACLSSTRKVKQNIEPLDVGLDEVMKLEPISYDLKPEFDSGHSGRQVGLIAEDVVKIDPRLVAMGDDGPRGVRYMQFTAVLTKAIQEQQQQIKSKQIQIYLLALALMGSFAFTYRQTRRRAA